MRLKGRTGTVLIALMVLLPVAAGVGLLVRERTGPLPSTTEPAQSRLAVSPTPESTHPVNPVAPVMRATIPGGVTPEMSRLARTVPGVAAAARITLSKLNIEAEGGEAEVSVAAVDPQEFRPLTPVPTAQADFVWEGLGRSESFIAHEQFPIFGGKPVRTLAAKVRSGIQLIHVGGLATNGVPNLAGVLISMQQAHLLGLDHPTLLVVGLQKGARLRDVQSRLARVLPGVKFESMDTGGRNFFNGRSTQRAIGSFRFTANEDGTITQDKTWVANHIVRRRVPILGSVTCHKVMIPQLEAALKEIQSAGLAGLVKPGQYGGCYVPRFVGRDRHRAISMHAWGLAVDINVAENPQGQTPKMDRRIVAIFERWGFRWGGRWSNPDGHHFELAALIRG
jgi:hypothetical protein